MRRIPWPGQARPLVFALGLGASLAAAAQDPPTATPSPPAARFAVRDAAVSETPSTHRFQAHAALRASDLPDAAPATTLRLKARLGGDALTTTCGAADGLFANGFE